MSLFSKVYFFYFLGTKGINSCKQDLQYNQRHPKTRGEGLKTRILAVFTTGNNYKSFEISTVFSLQEYFQGFKQSLKRLRSRNVQAKVVR